MSVIKFLTKISYCFNNFFLDNLKKNRIILIKILIPL